MKTILKNKWHLHTGLSLVAAILFLFLTDKFPYFMQIGYTGNFLQIFLAIFLCGWCAFLIEWIQSKFFGAKDFKTSWGDIKVSLLGAVLGILSYYTFTKVTITIAIVAFIVTLVLQAYKIAKEK